MPLEAAAPSLAWEGKAQAQAVPLPPPLPLPLPLVLVSLLLPPLVLAVLSRKSRTTRARL